LKNFSKNCTKKPVGRKHGGDRQKNQEQAPQISRNKGNNKADHNTNYWKAAD
jgi:hypothetical protein